jgi:peptidoglycan/xylan/chitin deacetylase (PgdA/CDA1 family)
MQVKVLMYHDVVAPGRHQESGFPEADAALYKLSPARFAAHLDALAAQLPAPALLPDTGVNGSWCVTFDDGGVSAATEIAPALASKNWRGYFFMTTDYIGREAFLSVAQLRELQAQGHVIGSHSCSHPPRFSALSYTDMLREWRDSLAKLADLLGGPVATASVPGGFYSREVARAAAEAGVKILFTSEPTAKTDTIDGCLIVGRYSIQRGTSPQAAAALAAGKFLPAAQQNLLWNTKKLAKKLIGPLYAAVRVKAAQKLEEKR